MRRKAPAENDDLHKSSPLRCPKNSPVLRGPPLTDTLPFLPLYLHREKPFI